MEENIRNFMCVHSLLPFIHYHTYIHVCVSTSPIYPLPSIISMCMHPRLPFILYHPCVPTSPIYPLPSIYPRVSTSPIYPLPSIYPRVYPQFPSVETVLTGLQDEFPVLRKRKNNLIFRIGVCVAGFLLGIPQTTQASVNMIVYFVVPLLV